MVTVEQIKEKLPKWPDKVIEEWLLYFANDIGWPPTEPLGADRWGGILGNRPPSWWADVDWKQEKVDCSRTQLSAATQQRIIVDRISDHTQRIKCQFSEITSAFSCRPLSIPKFSRSSQFVRLSSFSEPRFLEVRQRRVETCDPELILQ